MLHKYIACFYLVLLVGIFDSSEARLTHLIGKRQAVNPRDSAIFTCGALYNSPLDLLFPPSNLTVNLISNLSVAESMARQSVSTFCGNITAYSSCVQAGLRSPDNSMDSVLNRIVDVEYIDNWMNEFCSKAQDMSDNFRCTYNAVKSASMCGQGITDMLMALETMVQPGVDMSEDTVAGICSNAISELRCTWDEVVSSQCDTSYTTEMSFLYKRLFSCPVALVTSGPIAHDNGTSFVDFANFTDVYPCYQQYAQELTQRGENLFMHPGNKDTYMTDMMEFIVNEMEIICNDYIDTMMPCITRALETSNKPADLTMKRLLDYKHLQETTRYTCTLIPALKEHGVCLITNIQRFSQSNSFCFNNYVQQMSSVFMADPSLTSNGTEEFCSSMESVMKCIKPQISACDASLGNAWESSMWRALSCTDPNTSSASISTASVTSLLSMIFTIVVSRLLG